MSHPIFERKDRGGLLSGRASAITRRALGVAAVAIGGGAIAARASAEGTSLRDLKWTGSKPTFPFFHATASGGFAGPVEVRIATRSDPMRYRPFLAFYRLAEALGSRLVPRTEAIAVPLFDLLAALRKDPVGLALLRDELAIMNDGTVTVLVSEVVPGGRELDFFTSAEVKTWRSWAEGSKPVPRDRRGLVSGYVETLVLDYLSANTNRGTIVVDADAAAAAVHLVDNGAAFPARLDAGALDAVLAQLRRVSHFPRRLIAKVRAFDASLAEATLHPGTFGEWLVPRRPLAEMQDRRGAVLSLIDARAAELGEPAVFALP
jgi:hypothetical protein